MKFLFVLIIGTLLGFFTINYLLQDPYKIVSVSSKGKWYASGGAKISENSNETLRVEFGRNKSAQVSKYFETIKVKQGNKIRLVAQFWGTQGINLRVRIIRHCSSKASKSVTTKVPLGNVGNIQTIEYKFKHDYKCFRIDFFPTSLPQDKSEPVWAEINITNVDLMTK